MRIAVLSLASCGGCQQALLQAAGEAGVEIAAMPILGREWSGESVDVLFVEGCVTSEHHLRLLEQARGRCGKLVALGTCACFGGPSGLARLGASSEELARGSSSVDPRPPADLVEFDVLVPRCPPPPSMLSQLLSTLSRGERPRSVYAESTVCSQCPRAFKGVKGFRLELSRDPSDVEEGACLLSQGVLCLGPLTLGGCGAPCPAAGVPCIGCGGLSAKFIAVRGLRPIDALASLLAAIGGSDRDSALRELEDSVPPHSTHLFTSCSRIALSKPGSRILPLLRRL